MRVLVIGAGPAGARCAERVAERLAGAAVTLAGAEAALPYDRVALGRLLAGEVEAGALITHSLPRLRALGIRFRPAARIVAIDRAARCAIAASGERIGYDRLVLATGSRAIRLPLPGAERDGAFVYRSMGDVLAIRRAALGARRAIVIGGGLLGLEAATGLATLGLAVTVVHAVGWPMERQLDAGAGGLLARALGVARRIRFAMPAQAAALEGEGGKVGALRLADGTRIATDIVVMAVGVRAEVGLAAEAGLGVARGIVVDDAMRSGDPDIFAIGECAEHRGTVCGLVAPALAMAEAAAATMIGTESGYAARPDSAVLKISGIAVWSAGEIAPPDAEMVTLRDEAAGRYRRLWLRDGRLVGAVLFGDTADAPFYLDLIGSGAPVAAFRRDLAFGPAYIPGLIRDAA